MLGKTNKRPLDYTGEIKAADSKILTRITEFEKTDPPLIEAKNTPMGEAKRNINDGIRLDSLWSRTAVSQDPTKSRISESGKYVSSERGFYYRRDTKNGEVWSTTKNQNKTEDLVADSHQFRKRMENFN